MSDAYRVYALHDLNKLNHEQTGREQWMGRKLYLYKQSSEY